MGSPDFTILIPAKNAAATIARAVRSAVIQRPACVLLIDHASQDATVAIARETGGDLVRTIPVPAEHSLGRVRQAGVEALATTFGLWLDADDELLPGRAKHLIAAMRRENTLLAFDEAELRDGTSGRLLRHLRFPDFLQTGADLVRCFERNHLPAVGVPAFRAELARAVGYDASLHGAEDYDFLLRAITRRAPISLVRKTLYRQFAYEKSLSRDLANQRAMTVRALEKHAPAAVAQLLREAGVSEQDAAWTMVAFHVFRREYACALARLGNEAPASATPADRWRWYFQKGTLLLLLDRAQEAAACLEAALAIRRSADGLNNLGTALTRLDRKAEARACFAEALQLFPGYLDAAANLADPRALRVTSLPLRRQPARHEYS